MTHDLGQFTSDCAIHVLNHIEVSREEDIKVPLMDLSKEISRIRSIEALTDERDLRMEWSPARFAAGIESGPRAHSTPALRRARS